MVEREREEPSGQTIAYKIQSAHSFEELFAVLDQMDQEDAKFGGIVGSKKSYSGAELTAIIKLVRGDETLLGEVTRTSGLRDKVSELLALEKQSKPPAQE